MPNPLKIARNYFAAGYRFYRYFPKNAQNAAPSVFLIHGWGVRAVSMEKLASTLAAAGYQVFSYDYPSSRHTVAEHADILLKLYRETLTAEQLSGKILFVTHSLGGILFRGAIAGMTEAECRRIGAVVMLGPPNRGSIWASLGGKLLKPVNASLEDMALTQRAFVHHIPEPLFLPPVGIIAARYDGKVAFSDTALPDGQSFQRITVNCTHPGLRDPRHTLQPILHFLEQKKF